MAIHKPGPPPHAPAHGYRHKHRAHGVDLVFDTGLGVYLVVDYPGHYFFHDHYLRIVDGEWQLSANLHHGWKTTAYSSLPRGLKKKHGPKHGRHKGKPGRGHGPPAKHGY